MTTIEQQVEELEAAGWKKKSSGVWISPVGNLYRGPHGAWSIMRKSDPHIADAVAMTDAWKRYTKAFGEPPHGTIRQMAALLALLRAPMEGEKP